MASLAEVIVDVPTQQTNQTYDYLVPQPYQPLIEEGMRVVVPFGQGSRLVQGFVLALKDEEPNRPLKEIDSLMDLEPVLSKELLELGQTMAEETFAFQITCYQTMLPSALRATYGKSFVNLGDLDADTTDRLFQGLDEIPYEKAEERGILEELLALKMEKKVGLSYQVDDKRSYKKVRYVRPLKSFQAYMDLLEEVPQNAHQQIALLNLLLEEEVHPISFYTKDHGIPNATLNTGEERGWLAFEEREVYRDPYRARDYQETKPLILNEDQDRAYQEIVSAVEAEREDVFLLKGITGSGKTEVYMQVIQRVLDRGQTALMLVPEISLTPQMVQRFKGRFGDTVAVMHSGLSDGERFDEWRRAKNGEAQIVVGARSSVFAPVENLGVIIVDEEHETSYKQADNPQYHAINVAKWRGAYHSCPVVLGSATPSLESMARAVKGVYQLLEMNHRANQQGLPQVQIINMQEEALQGQLGTFSTSLKEKIEDRLAKKEQTVLLLNRRGYSSFVMCRDCGFVLDCPNCDISQTLHMDTRSMKCHYCGHEEGIPQVCPRCQSRKIRYFGTGTQKVEEELQDLFPQAKILRMDNDTTRRKGAYEKILKSFDQQEADILLGTQMVAKGLDFPNVTLVGVLNADTSLFLPDFRSSEKTFQLLTQVSGRAGRGAVAGEVLVQTYNPDHFAIQLAQKHAYNDFFNIEMNYRHRGNYSPYYFSYRISVSHENERAAAKKIADIGAYLQPHISSEAIMLGPTPKAIARLKNRYHYQIIIKYKNEPALKEALHSYVESHQKDYSQGFSVSIEPEPLSFM